MLDREAKFKRAKNVFSELIRNQGSGIRGQELGFTASPHRPVAVSAPSFLPVRVQGESFVPFSDMRDHVQSVATYDRTRQEFKAVVGFPAVALPAGDDEIRFRIQPSGGERADVIERRIYAGHRPGTIKTKRVPIDQAVTDQLASSPAVASNCADLSGRKHGCAFQETGVRSQEPGFRGQVVDHRNLKPGVGL